MAIEYVGGQVGGFAGKTGTTTVTFALTGGLAAVPAAGDLVVVAYSVGSTVDRALTINNPSAVPYTLAGTELTASDTFDANLRVAYRFMPGTPETTVVLSGTGSAQDAGAYTIHVFRGVDPVTPLDVAVVTATGIDSRVVNPGSINPAADAWVYVAGGAAGGTGGTFTSSFLTHFLATTIADTNDAMIGAGHTTSGGSMDPPAFTGGGTSTTSDSWCAVTMALRPEVVTVEGDLAAIEAADVAALAGDVLVAGSLVATETQDVAAFSGDVVVTGSLAASEMSDILAATGTVQDSSVTGTLAVVETVDSGAFSGDVVVSGDFAIVEDADVIIAVGDVAVVGALTVTEAVDILTIQGVVPVTGSFTVSEFPDVFAAEESSSLEDLPAGVFYVFRPLPVIGTSDLVAPASKFSGMGRVILQVVGEGRFCGYPAVFRAQGELKVDDEDEIIALAALFLVSLDD